MNGFLHRQHASTRRGFAAIELLCVLVILLMLVSIASSSMKRVREKTYITIDLANLRQILKGSAIYNADNNDHMAHPTWGADLTGPDGWAYLTTNGGRVPGAAAVPGSCAGRDVDSPQFTNQLAFFKKGQVTQYLDDVKEAWCPKDIATRKPKSRLGDLWRARPVKVTSYAWNGTIGGYIGPRQENLNGRTYKISQFLPTDWQMWEADDSDAFNFNDAAANPEQTSGTISKRHTNSRNWWNSPWTRGMLGGAVVGTFGGAGNFVPSRKVYDVNARRIPPPPNQMLNGPGYQPR